MALRQLIIERPPLRGKRTPVRIGVQVSDETPIGPWITTLAARLGYPLADRFGAPILYRLRSIPDGELLPTTGRFADARFHSGCRFLLEVDSDTTVPMQQPVITSTLASHAIAFSPRVSRRSLLVGGILTTLSLLGFGSGMTTAFAQLLLHQHSMGVSQAPTADPLTITVRTTFTRHQQMVRAVTWAPDESTVASGGSDDLALVWQLDGTVLRTLQFNAPVHALSWSPDGMQLVAGAANLVSFFDAQTGSLLTENMQQHTAPVTTLGWAETSTSAPLAISAGADQTAVVWNGQSHQPQFIFRQHTASIEALTVLADAVATASQGGIARVWNVASGQEIHGYFSETQQPLRAIAFSSTGALAIGSDDAMVHLWSHGQTCTRQAQDLFGLRCLDAAQHLQRHTRPVRAIAFSPDGAWLASGGDDRTLIIWSVQQKTPVLLHPLPDALVALSWSPSGQFLLGAIGSHVVLWQIHGEKQVDKQDKRHSLAV